LHFPLIVLELLRSQIKTHVVMTDPSADLMSIKNYTCPDQCTTVCTAREVLSFFSLFFCSLASIRSFLVFNIVFCRLGPVTDFLALHAIIVPQHSALQNNELSIQLIASSTSSAASLYPNVEWLRQKFEQECLKLHDVMVAWNTLNPQLKICDPETVSAHVHEAQPSCYGSVRHCRGCWYDLLDGCPIHYYIRLFFHFLVSLILALNLSAPFPPTCGAVLEPHRRRSFCHSSLSRRVGSSRPARSIYPHCIESN